MDRGHDRYCRKDPFYHSTEWDVAETMVDDELGDFGTVGAPVSLTRTLLVNTMHDAANLYAPRLLTVHTAPMAVALIRGGWASAEAAERVAAYRRSGAARPGESIAQSQAAVNATLTAWGEAHIEGFAERVEAASSMMSQIMELEIAERLAPMQLELELDDGGLSL